MLRHSVQRQIPTQNGANQRVAVYFFDLYFFIASFRSEYSSHPKNIFYLV